jgi:hypothetical protein
MLPPRTAREPMALDLIERIRELLRQCCLPKQAEVRP